MREEEKLEDLRGTGHPYICSCVPSCPGGRKNWPRAEYPARLCYVLGAWESAAHAAGSGCSSTPWLDPRTTGLWTFRILRALHPACQLNPPEPTRAHPNTHPNPHQPTPTHTTLGARAISNPTHTARWIMWVELTA